MRLTSFSPAMTRLPVGKAAFVHDDLDPFSLLLLCWLSTLLPRLPAQDPAVRVGFISLIADFPLQPSGLLQWALTLFFGPSALVSLHVGSSKSTAKLDSFPKPDTSPPMVASGTAVWCRDSQGYSRTGHVLNGQTPHVLMGWVAATSKGEEAFSLQMRRKKVFNQETEMS